MLGLGQLSTVITQVNGVLASRYCKHLIQCLSNMRFLCYIYVSVAIFAHFQEFKAYQAYAISNVKLENLKRFVYKLCTSKFLETLVLLIRTV